MPQPTVSGVPSHETRNAPSLDEVRRLLHRFRRTGASGRRPSPAGRATESSRISRR